MTNYVTLRQGNSNTEENKRLQQALKEAGYGSYLGSAGVDGIYGSGTAAAVKAYQKANGLTEDGIAGNQTLGKLYGTGQTQTVTQPQQTQTAAAPSGSYRYDADNDPVYQAALKNQEEVSANAPVYAGTFDQQVQELFDQVMNQKDFSYDLNGDALWQQYKDQYTTQGKLAMMDTMGQAAALTGGYGSSYAQNAGQQAYQGYMQQLNDRVPELYQLAMDKYNNDQAMLKDKLSAAVQMQADEYGKYQDAMDQHNIDVDRARSDVDTAYDRGSNAWYTEGQLKRQDEETAYSRQSDNFDRLANLIYSTGYTPSQSELEAAGMSAEQAAAYASSYEKQARADAAQESYSRQSNNFNKLVDLITSTGYTPSQSELEAAGMSPAQAAAYASYYETQAAKPAEMEIPSEIKSQIDNKTNSEKVAYISQLQESGIINSETAEYMRGVYDAYEVASYKTVDTDATKSFMGSVPTKREYSRSSSNKEKYGSYENYLEARIDEWLSSGRLNEDEAATLMAYYELI